MPILHSFSSLIADGAVTSLVRPSDWNAAHVIEASTITPVMLDRVYTVPADLDAYQLSSLISSAAFRTSTYFAISSVVTTHNAQTDPHTQYQLSSLVSSAAFRISSYFAISSHASSHQAGGSAALDITSLPGFPGGTANFLRADSTWAAPPGGAPSAHASTHITGGSDIIPVYAATSTGLAPLSIGSTTRFLRGDALWIAVPATTHASSHYAGGSDTINITSLPGFPGGSANFLRADSTWAAPGVGSDPWTYLMVSASHFAVSNVAVRTITGLKFTPGANSTYEFEGCLALRTGSTSINPLISISWPTGTSTGQGWINQAQSPTAQIMAFGFTNSTHVKTAGGSLATSNFPYPAIFGGFFRMGASPGSTFSITLASETSSTIFVSTLIGSFLKYRTI